MKQFLVFILCLFISPLSMAWTINSNFDSGAVGTKADGDDGFSGAFKYSVYSDARSQSGDQSSELSIKAGTNGFGEFGGSYKYSHLGNGDEIWMRVWAYFPNGFSFNCGGCSQGVKFMRIHTASESGNNEGYHSILLKDNAVEVDSEVTGKTFHSNNSGKKTVGEKNSTGRWHAYEIYIKFSSEPGKGIYRVWQNGNMVFEDTATNTLKTSSSRSNLIYLFSYWNNGAPQDQSAFVDNIIVTNKAPDNTDNHGNPFIGIGDFEQTAPPLPPSLN